MISENLIIQTIKLIFCAFGLVLPPLDCNFTLSQFSFAITISNCSSYPPPRNATSPPLTILSALSPLIERFRFQALFFFAVALICRLHLDPLSGDHQGECDCEKFHSIFFINLSLKFLRLSSIILM